MSWSFSDNGNGNGNNNGVLDTGETALLTLSVSFANQGGTANFSPPIGGISSGSILGLGSLFIDVQGAPGMEGSFNDSLPLANSAGTFGYGVRGGWRIAGAASNGNVNATGIDTIQIGQAPASPAAALTLDPVTNVFRFLWTPMSYALRGGSFTPVPTPGAGLLVAFLYVDLGDGTGAQVYLPLDHAHFSAVQWRLAPAPSGLLVGGVAMAWSVRRRRRQPPLVR